MTGIPDGLAAALAGRYTIERHVGAGGMATVYLARDVRHERQVAVKVLRPELATVLGADRFLQEIKVTANLQHPHILPLYDSGEAGGFLYYVMPYVEGESLRHKLEREQRLAITEATRIGIEAAEALDFAHRHGVVHRDVKPENILLQDGVVLVADFGIALALSQAGGGRLTETGLSVGTPRYMSPEQAAGQRELDRRSDIYALGTVVYEMLAGTTPFAADSLPELIASLVTETPDPVRARRPDVPEAISAAVAQALANKRDDRWSTAAEFARALAPASGTARSRLPAGVRRAIAVTGGTLAIVAAVVGFGLYRDAADRRWVRDVVTPELERLVGEAQFADAYSLARGALQRRPDDPELREYLERSTEPADITTDPPGARVLFRGYRTSDTTWHDAGRTPIRREPLPSSQLRLRFELAGHRSLEQSFVGGARAARLVPDGEPGDMVWIPAGTYPMSEVPVALDSFRIDRLEVTGREFQAFIDAGGYQDPAYWTEPFARDGDPVAFDDAVRTFIDRTGRPGPATWELSQYPPAEGDHPVGGVSWFEAAAYCRWAGKALPTYYHWMHAAGLGGEVWDDILAFSNFSQEGPVPAGSLGGVGPHGTEDMAGNVREWVWNESRGRRHILGGAWTDAEYLYNDGDAADPWSRAATNGFRCAAFASPPSPQLVGPIEQPFFDFTDWQPVDDETFAIFARFYQYEPTALDAEIQAVDTTEQWIKQTVSYAAAYGGERVLAYVFLPAQAPPPYQTIVYFPGAGAFGRESSEYLGEMELVSFVPRSGRALVYPIYKGSYERSGEPRGRGLARRRWTVAVTQDLHRTVDYIASRDDLRGDAVGFLGVSLGAELAVPIALEKRLRALVLIGGAFDPAWRDVVLPETAPWNFASRVTTPVMLINGRYDFMHPYETGQIPYFNAFDVAAEDKEFVVLEAGHIPPWNDVIGHALRWYDRYLGAVQ